MQRSMLWIFLASFSVLIAGGCDDFNQNGAADSEVVESAEEAAEHAEDAAQHAREAAESADQLTPEPTDPKERAAHDATESAEEAADAAADAAEAAEEAAEEGSPSSGN